MAICEISRETDNRCKSYTRDKSDLKRIIARRVKTSLFDAGLSCKDLARATGISENTILRIANGKGIAGVDKIMAIADVLDCSVDWLLGRADQQRRYD